MRKAATSACRTAGCAGISLMLSTIRSASGSQLLRRPRSRQHADRRGRPAPRGPWRGRARHRRPRQPRAARGRRASQKRQRHAGLGLGAVAGVAARREVEQVEDAVRCRDASSPPIESLVATPMRKPRRLSSASVASPPAISTACCAPPSAKMRSMPGRQLRPARAPEMRGERLGDVGMLPAASGAPAATRPSRDPAREPQQLGRQRLIAARRHRAPPPG